MMVPEQPLSLAVGPRRFELQRDPDKFAVVYDDTLATMRRHAVEEQVLNGQAPVRFEIPGFKLTVLGAAGTEISAQYGPLSVEAAFGARPEVVATLPVFILDDKRVVLTPQISVGFDPAVTRADDVAAAAGLSIVSQGVGFVILRTAADDDVAARAAQVAGIRGVRFAEPDLVTLAARLRPSPHGIGPSSAEPQGIQAAFQNVFAPAAWQQAGNLATVRLAILDDGVDLGHPALSGAVAASFDATSSTNSAAPDSWDYHGTACAGLACGLSPGAAFRGLAGGARLLAVKVARSPAPGLPWATSNSILRQGIDWAVSNGADVISNSWGGPPSAIIADGVAAAVGQGRGGKGAVVVFAAGNSGGPVDFPASLSGCIAVSGVNLADELKTFTSSDRETWWSSNIGPEVDIAAPAVNLTTCDISGAAGHTPSAWRDDFNGTSAACPIVAGAAALVLSVAPDLTADRVAAVLTGSADKIGAAPYDDNGRNPYFGAGRLNVAAAVARALNANQMTGRPALIALSDSVRLCQLVAAGGETAVFLPHPTELAAIADAAATAMDIGVTFANRIASPIGTILSDARLAARAGAVGPPPVPAAETQGEPAPGEVLLPRPEDDVFSAASAVPAPPRRAASPEKPAASAETPERQTPAVTRNRARDRRTSK